MKIAVLSSGRGEKAIHILDFFREGNRVEIDCLVTDREDTEIGRVFEKEGIPVYYFAEEDWRSGETILSLLRERGEEMIVVDELDVAVPEAVSGYYGEAVVSPSGVAEAPGEIVSIYNHITSKNARAKTSDAAEKKDKSPEEEWADVLKIEYDAEEAAARATPPPLEEGPTPSVEEAEPVENPSESPTEPREQQGYDPGYRQGYGPGFQQGYQKGYGQAPGYQQPWNPYHNRQGAPYGPEGNREPMPDTYLVWAVLVTIFCCLIPGIVAIIMSSSVSSRYFSGDIEGARRASRRAEIWIIISIVCGIIWLSLYIPLMLLSA